MATWMCQPTTAGARPTLGPVRLSDCGGSVMLAASLVTPVHYLWEKRPNKSVVFVRAIAIAIAAFGFVIVDLFEGGETARTQQHPARNHPMETPSWSVPALYRNRSAREAAPDMATTFVIIVNHWAGKYA